MPDVPQPAQPTPPPPAPPGRAREVSRLALLTVRFLGYLVYVYIAIVEAILVLGFFLRLFGANPNTDFVDFIYRSLDRIMAPFRAIFDPIELGTAPNDVPAVLDTSILFAMIFYGLLLLALHAILHWFGSWIARWEAQQRPPQDVERQ